MLISCPGYVCTWCGVLSEQSGKLLLLIRKQAYPVLVLCAPLLRDTVTSVFRTWNPVCKVQTIVGAYGGPQRQVSSGQELSLAWCD